MRPQSPHYLLEGVLPVLKESDDHAKLGVTFDSKMTSAKHLCSVSIAASQTTGILRKSWRGFHDGLLLGDAFGGFYCQFWSSVLQCGVRLPIHTLKFWTV